MESKQNTASAYSPIAGAQEPKPSPMDNLHGMGPEDNGIATCAALADSCALPDAAVLLRRPAFWIVVILAYALLSRCWDLAEKVMHHDESLFAYYGFWLFRGHGYDYQPILHGPILQYASAIIFWLFGDNQLTMRLPSLLGGLAMFPVLWLWRRYLGTTGTIAAFALVALSPALTYYTRFLRNDVPYLTVTMMCAWLLLKALETGGVKYVWGAILSATIMFSMMESSIFFFAACIGFLCVITMSDWILGRIENPPLQVLSARLELMADRPIRRANVIVLIMGAVCVTALEGWLYYRILNNAIPLGQKMSALFSRSGIPFSLHLCNVLLLIALLAVNLLLAIIVRENFTRPRGRDHVLHLFLHRIWQNRWAVAGAIGLSVALYQVLFTTFFTFTETKSFSHIDRNFTGPVRSLTPVQIYQNTWDYWWDQHKLHRIKGPFHYYLPILLLYELPLLMLVCFHWCASVWKHPRRWTHLAVFLGVQVLAAFCYWGAKQIIIRGPWEITEARMWEFLDAKFHLTHGFHLILILLYAQILLHLVPLLYFCGRRIEAFLSFWSVTSLFAYSYAGEKVPWLTVHVVGPLILVAAIQIRDWKILHGLPSRRRTAVLTALLIIAVVYQVRNNYLLNQTNAAIPSERLVYNHTSPDMAEAMKIIERVELETGFGKQLPIFVQGEMAWPMHWYLRHRPNSVTATEESLDVTTRPLVMVDWSEARNENLNRNYYLRRMKVREWWVPPMLDIGAMTGIWRVLTPTESRTDANDAHIQYAKCILEWQKLWHYLAYREIWIDPFNPDWSNGANEFVFGIRKDLSSTYLNSNWLGLLPKRRDITIFP